MSEKRILIDEKLKTEKQYRFYFPKVSIQNSEKAYEQAEYICKALQYKYNLAIRIGFVEVGEISSELSVYALFHSQYRESVFGFLVRIKEQMLSQGWLIEEEAPVEIYDPEPVAIATPPAEKTTIEDVLAILEKFYQDHKTLVWVGMGSFAFLILILAISRRSD
ncbi:hypothetical protein ES702_07543 [subsurface metagenome]